MVYFDYETCPSCGEQYAMYAAHSCPPAVEADR